MKYFSKLLLFLAVTLNCLNSFAQPGGYAGEKPNVNLRVSINGVPVLGEADLEKKKITDASDAAVVLYEIDKNTVSIKRNSSLQLKIEMIDTTGHVTDVTNNSYMGYDTGSPWRLTVTPKGLVKATPRADFVSGQDGVPAPLGQAFIWTVFNSPTQSGWNRVIFNVVP